MTRRKRYAVLTVLASAAVARGIVMGAGAGPYYGTHFLFQGHELGTPGYPH
jgi:hypothetical protein